MPLPPLEAWQVILLRLTAFVDTAGVGPADRWNELLGYPPDSITHRPRAAQYQEEGKFEGGKLSLRIQPELIEWLLVGLNEADDEPTPSPATIGRLPEATQPFVALMQRWLPNSPPIVRLAFGANLLQPVADRRSGYQQLASYLPSVSLDPDNSSDFLYQINRRRISSLIPNLPVNRLCRWSVNRSGRVAVRLAQTRQLIIRESEAVYSCRLELDINSAPEFPDPLPQDKSPDFFGELVRTGLEIAERGDIP